MTIASAISDLMKELSTLKEENRRLHEESENVRFANIESAQWVDCAKKDIERLTRERNEMRAALCMAYNLLVEQQRPTLLESQQIQDLLS